jgi:hypothetical protein
MIKRMVMGVCLLAAVGCSGINETYKLEVDKRVASLHATSASFPQQDGSPQPLAVGQWAEYRLTGSNKRPGFATYKIVGQQGEAFWVETTLTTYSGKQETRMLIDFGDRSDPEKFKVHAVEMRSNDRPMDIPPGTMQLMSAMWKPVLSAFVIDWAATAPRENASASAGDFAGCYKRRLDLSVGGYHQKTDAWMHPAVPINGIVRSASVGKNPSLTELIAFGNEGAKSAFGP